MHEIANAIYDAVDMSLHHAPFTAEKILNSIEEKAKEETAQKVAA